LLGDGENIIKRPGNVEVRTRGRRFQQKVVGSATGGEKGEKKKTVHFPAECRWNQRKMKDPAPEEGEQTTVKSPTARKGGKRELETIAARSVKTPSPL